MHGRVGRRLRGPLTVSGVLGVGDELRQFTRALPEPFIMLQGLAPLKPQWLMGLPPPVLLPAAGRLRP